jgi:hypothetical protein
MLTLILARMLATVLFVPLAVLTLCIVARIRAHR